MQPKRACAPIVNDYALLFTSIPQGTSSILTKIDQSMSLTHSHLQGTLIPQLSAHPALVRSSVVDYEKELGMSRNELASRRIMHSRPTRERLGVLLLPQSALLRSRLSCNSHTVRHTTAPSVLRVRAHRKGVIKAWSATARLRPAP